MMMVLGAGHERTWITYCSMTWMNDKQSIRTTHTHAHDHMAQNARNKTKTKRKRNVNSILSYCATQKLGCADNNLQRRCRQMYIQNETQLTRNKAIECMYYERRMGALVGTRKYVAIFRRDQYTAHSLGKQKVVCSFLRLSRVFHFQFEKSTHREMTQLIVSVSFRTQTHTHARAARARSTEGKAIADAAAALCVLNVRSHGDYSLFAFTIIRHTWRRATREDANCALTLLYYSY